MKSYVYEITDLSINIYKFCRNDASGVPAIVSTESEVDQRPLPSPENFQIVEIDRDTANLVWDAPADDRRLTYK